MGVLNGTNQITSIKSDGADASGLATMQRGGGAAGNTSMFTISGGFADADPLTIPGAGIINPHTAMQIPAFYSAVRFIAETIATLPKNVYQLTATGPQRMGNHAAEWTMNKEPSALNTPFTFWSTFLLHAIVWSNGFAALNTGPGDPEIFNLPPDRMYPFRINGVQWYVFDLEVPQKQNNPNSRYLVFSADEIIHLPALSFDGMQGLPMVQMQTGALRTSKNTEGYVDKYFGQGGLIRGVLQTDQQMTADQINEALNLIRNKYSGVDNAHKWMILANGLKATSLSPALDTAQTEANRKFSVQEVCRMLRVPPHIVYELGKATWANIESLGIEVVKYTLNNWIVPLAQELSRKMLTRAERKAGYYIDFEVAALLRGDHAAQIDGAVKRSANGITTVDEERATMGLPPYPDGIGAIPRVPANTTPIAPAAAPESNPDDAPPPANDEELSKKISPLILDAAARIMAKTEKATAAAQLKNKGNAAAFTAWGNVFAEQQAAFVDATIKPIVEAFSLPNKQTGEKYATELRKHFAAMNRGEESAPPTVEFFKEAIK